MSTKLTDEIAECLEEIDKLQTETRIHEQDIRVSHRQIRKCEDDIAARRSEITKWQSRLDAGETDIRLDDVMVLPELNQS